MTGEVLARDVGAGADAFSGPHPGCGVHVGDLSGPGPGVVEEVGEADRRNRDLEDGEPVRLAAVGAAAVVPDEALLALPRPVGAHGGAGVLGLRARRRHVDLRAPSAAHRWHLLLSASYRQRSRRP